MDNRLLEAVAVTAEVMGTQMSEAAATVFAEDLDRFPLALVLDALTRCRRDVRGRLVLADVISRIDDGRPGAEEAWAMIPKNEDVSGVWTEEMQAAMKIAGLLLRDGDTIAARMAFKETYLRECQQARDDSVPVCWQPTLGESKSGRDEATHEAINRNRLTEGLPALPYTPRESDTQHPRLSGPSTIADTIASAVSAIPNARAAIAAMRAKLKP